MAFTEIKGLSLSLEELKDSLKYEQGRPPITIVKYKTIIEERIIEVPVITKDTVIKQGNNSFNSILSFNSDSNWIKSSRSISVDLPYSFIDSLTFGSATVGLKQNIWLDATLSQDISTREIFIKYQYTERILVFPPSFSISFFQWCQFVIQQ